ncbi:hypothetical protein OEZ86_013579 [Tetradesmus obliquus]|nr:hypothetical protein OEZ86_013579 [Tetradesmus obliquus]
MARPDYIRDWVVEEKQGDSAVLWRSIGPSDDNALHTARGWPEQHPVSKEGPGSTSVNKQLHALFSVEPAVDNVNKGNVRSVPVGFKGHNLTVVALANDEYVGKTIIDTKEPYQPELLGPLMDAVRPGSTVIDAGANMGGFSMFFAAATGPTGALCSFEPQARMYQLLCTNMIINNLLHIQPMRNALSYAPGIVNMSATVSDGSARGKTYKDADKWKTSINYGGMLQICNHCTDLDSRHPRWHAAGRRGCECAGHAQPAIALDSLGLTDVSVLQVDIQGAEKAMFYGAQETIKRSLPVIAYEAAERGAAAELDTLLNLPQHVRDFRIEEFLASLGYSVEKTTWDNIARPPGKHAAAAAGGGGGGRRSVLALPPRRR